MPFDAQVSHPGLIHTFPHKHTQFSWSPQDKAFTENPSFSVFISDHDAKSEASSTQIQGF